MDKKQQMVREEKLRYWRPIINAYENRETKLMSIAQWCREHEINASLFYYWKNVIRETDASNRKASSGSVPETENFVDITDIVNGQARPDVNTIARQAGRACRVSGSYPGDTVLSALSLLFCPARDPLHA